MTNLKQLPLRIGVGIVLLNHQNKVFVGKRIDNPQNFWQMPQGGVDENEDFLQAAKRELKEETGFRPIRMFIADHVSRFYETHGDRVNLVPVFGIEVDDATVTLSKEHCEFRWVDFDTAHRTLVWSGQKDGVSAVFNMLNSDDDRIKWSEVSV